MATTLNTRIKLKYGQYSEWLEKDPILLAGEVGVAVCPVDAGSGMIEPCVIMKVGDGTSKYSELEIITAKAGDVLEACKTTAGLTKFVTDVLADAGVAGDAEMKELAGRVDTLEDLVGTESVADQIAKHISTAYKAAGSVASADALPAASAENLGNVYNVTAEFTTTADFVEGAGKTVPAGSNVVIVETKAGTPAQTDEEGNETVAAVPAEYGYDVVGSFIDLSNYYTKAEVDALIPEAVKEALEPTTEEDPENPGETVETKSPLLEKVEEIITSEIDGLNVADDGEAGVVTKVTQTKGLIEVVKKVLESTDISDFETAVAARVQTAFDKPVYADPENPTEEEKAEMKVYEDLLEEVQKMINEALGVNGEGGSEEGLAKTITEIVEKAILEAGTPAEGEDPATEPSPLNTAVTTVVTTELDKLDVADTGEGVVTSVTQTDGLIAVAKKILAAADISDFTKVVKETLASAVKEPVAAEDPENPGETLPVNPTDQETYDAIVNAVVDIVMEQLGKKTVSGEGGEGSEEVPVNNAFYDEIRTIVAEMVNEALAGEGGEDGEETATLQETIERIVKESIEKAATPGEEGEEGTPAGVLNDAVNGLIDEKLGALEVTDTASEYEVTKLVNQADGKVVSTKVTLAKVAFTGKFSDLVQEVDPETGEAEEVILDGGSI